MNEYKYTDTDWLVEAQNGDSVRGLAVVIGGDPSTGAYQYQLRDRLGSVRDIRSQAKARLAEYTFEPYGDVWSSSGLALNQGFTGHTWDAALGMYHTAYRRPRSQFYANVLARRTKSQKSSSPSSVLADK